MEQYSDDDLKKLFNVSLEFGEHWCRPIIEWARKLWPGWDSGKQMEISNYISSVRNNIEKYILDRYDYKKGQLTVSEEQVKGWITQNYPWMSSENVTHAYSQGMYYAWHG
jgi:hypothetical protein